MTTNIEGGEAMPKSSFKDLLTRYNAAEAYLNSVPAGEEYNRANERFTALIKEVGESAAPATTLAEAISAMRQAMAEEEGNNPSSLTGSFLSAAMKYFDANPQSSFRTLEEDVGDLVHMTGIVYHLAEDVLIEQCEVKGNYAHFAIGIDHRERLLFAVSNVDRRAKELKDAYYAAVFGEKL